MLFDNFLKDIFLDFKENKKKFNLIIVKHKTYIFSDVMSFEVVFDSLHPVKINVLFTEMELN